MRTITTDLLNRVKAKWQGSANNADPAMKVYLSRGFINELFQTFTIQEGSTLEEVDVTVKRTDTAADPAEAFALALNNGVATVLSKPLPYDDMIPWVTEYQVATGVSSVAIEFDGYWDRELASRRFNFVTEETPWLFYIQSGVLTAQLGQNGTPFVLVESGAVKVAAIRGWLPANGDQSNDQGLIIAYIKTDGLLYYRAYCIQADSLKSWGTETQVAAFTGTITDLALFRTNDFRIGFMAEIAGETWWTLTTRNWAGMSVWPDIISMGLAPGAASFTVYEVTTHAYETADETAALGLDNMAAFNILNAGETAPVDALTAIGGVIVDEHNFYITFSHPVFLWNAGYANRLLVELAVIGASAVGNTLSIETAAALNPDGFEVTVAANLVIGQITASYQTFFDGGAVQVRGAVQPHEITLVLNLIASGTFDAYEVTRHAYTAYPFDTATLGAGLGTITFDVTEASKDPV